MFIGHVANADRLPRRLTLLSLTSTNYGNFAIDAPMLEYASLQGVYAVVGVDSEKEWPKNLLSGSVGLQNAPLLHNGSTYSILGGVVVPATSKDIATERQSCGFRFSLYVYC